MSSIKPVHKIVFISVISLLFIVPSINSVLRIWEFDREDENRNFRDEVNFNKIPVDSFSVQIDEYINDNFSFRAPLLDLYHSIKFNVFNISPNPSKVVIGKDNWYFLGGKEQEVYEGKRDLSIDELESLLIVWRKKKNYLDSLGIPFYWVIIPSKHYIYSEKLPFNVQKSVNPDRINVIKEYFAHEFPELIIDPTDQLINNKKKALQFRRLDNHWSNQGGYTCSQLLLNHIQNRHPSLTVGNIPSFEWKDSLISQGIHVKNLGVDNLVESIPIPMFKQDALAKKISYNFEAPDFFPYPWEYEHSFKMNKDSSRFCKMLMIRDSFGEQMMPFMKDSFQESVFIFDGWKYLTNEEIVERVKPDIVVFAMLESNVRNLIH